MAKKASPWFWEARQGWYVNVDGKRHFLGEHPADAPKPAQSKKTKKWNSPASIDEAFRRLMGREVADAPGGDLLGLVLDDFLTWTKENRSSITAKGYERFCQDFMRASEEGGDKFGKLPIGKLTSRQVTAWLNQRPTWGSTMKRNAITAIMRGLNWAVKNRGLASNPIRGMEKPEGKRRTEVVTPEDLEAALKLVSSDFRDLMTVSFDSGGRPFEIKDLERRHLQLDRQRAVIPASEAKGRKHARTIYFPSERSMEIVKRLSDTYQDGPLFRNKLGNKWTGNAVKCTFARIEAKLGKRLRHYGMRHSFITRKLVAGVDSHVVAKLAGHQDTKMIDQVYSHVADDYEFMLRQASKDVSPKKDSGASEGESKPPE